MSRSGADIEKRLVLRAQGLNNQRIAEACDTTAVAVWGLLERRERLEALGLDYIPNPDPRAKRGKGK
jgi:hypothetical protein